jgi:hypothetical protein
MPILDTPAWIVEGVNILSFIAKLTEEERTQEERKDQRRLQRSL